MATNYPSGIDSLTNPSAGDALTSPSHSAQHANANDAIEAIETELGTTPSGSETTVAARLTAIESGARMGTGSIGATALADNAVDTAAIQDGAVTPAKLATTGRFTFPTGAANGYGFASGAVHLSGTGSPEGVVTAEPGSTWLQTDATTDVKGWLRWIKATGTGNTGWVAGPEADTGWRSLLVWTATDTFSAGTTPDTTTFTYEDSGQINIRRVGTAVYLRLASGSIKMASGSSAWSTGAFVHLPSGFGPTAPIGLHGLAGGFWLQAHDAMVSRQGNSDLPAPGTYTGGNASLSFPTTAAWPSSLPGSAA